MRNPIVGMLAMTLVACAIVALSPTTDVGHNEVSESPANHGAASPASNADWPTGAFFVSGAGWDEEARQLIVQVRTLQEKGTFLTLSGLPASTWVDAFTISDEHAADFQLPLAEGQAIPCQVTVRSALASVIVPVKDAPVACGSLLDIEGTVTAKGGLPLTSGRVIVAVGGNMFTTTTDPAGNYELEVYNESDDPFVSITAEAMVGSERLDWQIYQGSISGLRGGDGLQARGQAVEPFLRYEGRVLLAKASSD